MTAKQQAAARPEQTRNPRRGISDLSLPDIGMRFWIVIWSSIIIICLVAAFITRASYTDYNSNPNDLANLPFMYLAATSNDLNFSQTQQPDAEDRLASNANELLGDTPIIVAATFNGERHYGYQSFVSDLTITKVYRGTGLTAGQTLKVFEQLKITKLQWLDSWKAETPDTFNEFVERFDLATVKTPRVLTQAGGTSIIPGYTMMAEGREYILLLHAKSYPPSEDRTGKTQEYVFQNSAYSRIAMTRDSSTVNSKTDAAANIAILDPSHDFISAQESSDYDIIVADSNAARIYQQTRDTMLANLAAIKA
jgi:hypothetical protein